MKLSKNYLINMVMKALAKEVFCTDFAFSVSVNSMLYDYYHYHGQVGLLNILGFIKSCKDGQFGEFQKKLAYIQTTLLDDLNQCTKEHYVPTCSKKT